MVSEQPRLMADGAGGTMGGLNGRGVVSMSLFEWLSLTKSIQGSSWKQERRLAKILTCRNQLDLSQHQPYGVCGPQCQIDMKMLMAMYANTVCAGIRLVRFDVVVPGRNPPVKSWPCGSLIIANIARAFRTS